MEIKSTNANNSNTVQTKNPTIENQETSVKFADELQELEKSKEAPLQDDTLQNTDIQYEKPANKTLAPLTNQPEEKIETALKTIVNKTLDSSINQSEEKTETVLKTIVNKTLDSSINQSEEKTETILKKPLLQDDNNIVINNDFNIQPDKDKLPLTDMNMNMNFSGDGQPFAAFMNKNEKSPDEILKSTATELAEEAAILSTMTENLAIANKNRIETISNEEGIKKVDSKTGIKIETVVKYDSIIMNQADVEVFANLVENKEINMNNITAQTLEKSVKVSKTLADMLHQAKENNQPLRIDFDNNISVIIRISRDGKISADFLPSSQVAEAYLKENLPILKQRFDENNIEYDELNQRENRNKNKENNNRKEGRKDE